MPRLPNHIKAAIRCGPVPKRRNWRDLPLEELTRAEKNMAFIREFCRVPEGRKVGQEFELADFQEAFIYAVYDNPHGTRRAILSIARKNGKTALLAALLLVHIVGPEAQRNSQIISGAMSRDQAALVFSLATKMIGLNNDLSTICRYTASSKKIAGLIANTEFKALAAEATTAYGLSPVFAVLDEVGQIVGPSSPFVEAITTAQGAHESPLLISISTQAPSDGDMLSLWIDDAERSEDKHTVCHVYETDETLDLEDKKGWKQSNPGLDLFRGRRDLEESLSQAARLPSMEASSRNLLLNQRVALESLFCAPSVWKKNGQSPNLALFTSGRPVCLAADLSKRVDLTAVVAAVMDDDDNCHLLPWVFAPSDGMLQRGLRDKAPYIDWVKQGKMFATPGETVDYHWICEFLLQETEDMRLSYFAFDRWRIDVLEEAAKETGLYGEVEEWRPVGQGYKDYSPRLEAFEALLLGERIFHGSHPLLNMAAAHAVAVMDPAGNRKLDKSKTSQRIDPLVAAVMAAFEVSEGSAAAFDVGAFIA